MSQSTQELIGHCAVDSGQLLITDPCYLGNFVNDDYSPDAKPGAYSYSGVCATTLGNAKGGGLKFSLGHLGQGVAIGTASGDGVYPVYVERDRNGGIVKAIIELS